ncbi:MAG: hypothetical protein AABX98_00385 [Nanoarchaeota archaeon]
MADEKESKKPLVKKKALLSKKKKSWFQILAPDIFGKAVIGETIIEDSKQLMGKCIELSLMSLTGDMKKQNVSVTFRVDKVLEGKGHTQLISYDLSPASIKRLVRRGRMRVDASFVCQTKDGVKIRVKPFLLTAHETNKSILSSLRKYASAFIATYVSLYDYDVIFKDIVSGKLQAGVRQAVHTIYPIRSSEIRILHLLKDSIAVTALPNPNINVEKILEAASQARQTRRPMPQRHEQQRSEEPAAA